MGAAWHGRMARTRSVAATGWASGRRAVGLPELVALAIVTIVFAAWAAWTLLLPSGPDPAYRTGTFGPASHADYTTDLDRRLAPQRAIGRG